MTEAQPVAPEVDRAIRDALSDWFGGELAATVEIRGDLDHDGDPVIYVDVYHPLSETPVQTSAFYGVIGHVRRRLAELGEMRFPHVRNHFHEDQKVAV